MSGLEEEFCGEIKTENLNAREPESQKAIKDAGFQTHGLIIRNSNDETVWKQADHTVKIDDVRAAIRKLLKPDA